MSHVIDRTSTETAPASPAIHVRDVWVRRGADILLRGADLSVERGELVAIAGPSGAGKTTLLRVAAGLLTPTRGLVSYAEDGRVAGGVGYVPQDDIVPLDLPVRRVLALAADLVLDESSETKEQRVGAALATMRLSHRADAVVRTLSGGERKRVNVAVELLTGPERFLLDEPTSGLDPEVAAQLVDELRAMSRDGAAVALTTHAAADIERCDRVVFLARGGTVAFAGTPDAARAHFGVDDLVDVYPFLHLPALGVVEPSTGTGAPTTPLAPRLPTSWARQWRTLTRRGASSLVRNRLTLAILVGSPVFVTAMMATLFPVGGFADGASAIGAQESYWLAFDAFFFGLTYGLLQIVVEMPIVRRDRARGASLAAYLAAKCALLIPVLVLADGVMLAVLRMTDRLPALGWSDWAALTTVLALVSVAALATGLLASAAVADTTQATLALPMICFPQVLFAGALVPRSAMTPVGRTLGDGLVTRWGFSGIGRSIGYGRSIPTAAGFGPTFTPTVAHVAVVLVVITALMLGGAVVVLRRRTATGS